MLRKISLALGLFLSAAFAMAGSYEDFFKALESDNDALVRNLLLKGFDPNTLNADGMPAISAAMAMDANKSVRALLLTKTLDVNQADFRGDTPLMVASIKNNAAWVAALLGKGADLKNEDYKWTALHYAAASGSVKAIGMLFDAGARLNALSPNGTTPLMMAAREGKQEAVQWLLEKGADPTVVNQSGYNAAGYAMKGNNKPLAMEIMIKARDYQNNHSPS